MTLSTVWLLLKETAIGWDQDNIARHGAALSFYTLFSMAPLLLIVIAIAGSAFGREAVEGRIVEEIQLLVGASGARTVQEVIRNSSGPGRSATALTIGLVTFLLGATAAFAALQGALNAVWNVEPRPGNAIWSFIRTRLISFAMVVGSGFLLLVSLVVSAGLGAVSDALGRVIPGRSESGRRRM
ncbi:MAG: YihY/virulence factor BrkB family protein [Gemmatimonadales bacterium]